MCERRNGGRIDTCIRRLVDALRRHPDFEILASCCGHGRYPLTLVVRDRTSGQMRELVSGVIIPRRRNFYRRDCAGFYRIPELP